MWKRVYDIRQKHIAKRYVQYDPIFYFKAHIPTRQSLQQYVPHTIINDYLWALRFEGFFCLHFCNF